MTDGTSRRAKRAQKKASGEDVNLRESEEVSSELDAEGEGDGEVAVDAGATPEGQPQQRIKDRNQRLRAEAAARRQAKREAERAESAPVGLDAGEMVDDALARATHSATQWLRRHFTLVQWMIVLAVVGGLGWQVYSWRAQKTAGKRSDALATAVSKFEGWVDEAPSEETTKLFGTVHPAFSDDASRLKAATDAFNAASALAPGSTTGMLAKLGLAGVLYQQGKYDEALQHYEALKGAAVYRDDTDVKGRVLEGIAFCREAKGDKEGALKAFKELANADLLGFTASGLYHQARLLFAEGKKEEAKKALGEAKKRLEKWRTPDMPPLPLENSIRDLGEAMDPGSSTGASVQQVGGRQLSDDPAELQRLLDNLVKSKGKAAPSAPPANAPQAPADSAPAPSSP